MKKLLLLLVIIAVITLGLRFLCCLEDQKSLVKKIEDLKVTNTTEVSIRDLEADRLLYKDIDKALASQIRMIVLNSDIKVIDMIRDNSGIGISLKEGFNKVDFYYQLPNLIFYKDDVYETNGPLVEEFNTWIAEWLL